LIIIFLIMRDMYFYCFSPAREKNSQKKPSPSIKHGSDISPKKIKFMKLDRKKQKVIPYSLTFTQPSARVLRVKKNIF